MESAMARTIRPMTPKHRIRAPPNACGIIWSSRWCDAGVEGLNILADDGYCLLPSLLGSDAVECAREAVRAVIANPHGEACERPNNTLVPLRWDDAIVSLVAGDGRRRYVLTPRASLTGRLRVAPQTEIGMTAEFPDSNSHYGALGIYRNVSRDVVEAMKDRWKMSLSRANRLGGPPKRIRRIARGASR
jgi:hypothetical protein